MGHWFRWLVFKFFSCLLAYFFVCFFDIFLLLDNSGGLVLLFINLMWIKDGKLIIESVTSGWTESTGLLNMGLSVGVVVWSRSFSYHNSLTHFQSHSKTYTFCKVACFLYKVTLKSNSDSFFNPEELFLSQQLKC